jgi:hypothetical chaperone protein
MHSTLGLDFGTTNTVLSLCEGGVANTVALQSNGIGTDTVRTVLALWNDDTKKAQDLPQSEIGPWALAEFNRFPEDTRFIQSMKTYAASKAFENSVIFGKPYSYAELMHLFLKRLLELTKLNVDEFPKVVVGRPIRFAGFSANAELAMARYSEALAKLQLHDVRYVHEPVAAAFSFARRLTGSATVLIADFGGGTTDFSLLHFDVASSRVTPKILGVGGVGIAGDQFDYRIMENTILPHLGRHSSYLSMGKEFELPNGVFSSLARWNELSFLRHSRQFRDFKKLLPACLAPEKVEKLIAIVDDNQGPSIHAAVSDVKQSLTPQKSAALRHSYLGANTELVIDRDDFEAWIRDDIALIGKAMQATLDGAGVDENSVDLVFMTGGSSLVPAIRRMFSDKFGAGKLRGGEELVSVSTGLALVGQSDEWLSRMAVIQDGHQPL